LDELNSLFHGFAVALTFQNLLLMMVGVLLGVLIGVLPGLGGANGVAILLPLTFSMNPTSAIIMLSCIYWGRRRGRAGWACSRCPADPPARGAPVRPCRRHCTRPLAGAPSAAPGA
jgi:hypothetical protein